MRLVQFEGENGKRQVGQVDENSGALALLADVERVYDLAMEAIQSHQGLGALAARRRTNEMVDYDRLLTEKRVLPPLDHPDPAHLIVSGTGLSHLGSAQARADMHAKLADEAELTDSMKMFKRGIEGGKPQAGAIGAQPEWFYKGDGTIMVGAERPLVSPGFAMDGGEEAEVAGLYVVGDDGAPYRVGFAIGNEFADHVMERRNYLDLAHSKLRQCGLGPELLTGPLPDHVAGTVRVRRGDQVLWSGEFLSGESNMSYTIANLEHHHFKYPLFRRPGDAHVHFFGAGILSFGKVETKEGDVFEVDVPTFGRPLRNPLKVEPPIEVVAVKGL